MHLLFHQEIIHQSISLVGALFVLIAYLGQQLRRMEVNSVTYNLFNTIGSTLLVYVSLHPMNIGFLLAESVWFCTSLVSLYTALTKSQRKNVQD